MAAVPLRVLIVDDNPGDARLVEISLSKEPGFAFHCERASRISAAVERVARGDIDTVLLDLGLPDSQGTEGLRRIRAAARSVAVVVLSGTDSPEVARSAVAAGAQDYLVKGIFPPGYLGWTIRLAVVIRGIEVGLEDERAIPAGSLDELNEAHLGAAVIAPHGFTHWNSAFTELAGWTPTGAEREFPPWLRALLGAPAIRDPVASPSRSLAEPASLDVGQFVIEGAHGPGPALEYMVRRFPSTTVPRQFLMLRSAEPHLRASHRVRAAPVARPAGSGAPQLDGETWENLRELAGADASFLPSLVGAFRREGQRLAGALQSAVDDADTARVGRIAHTLKSTCAQVGALDLARTCSALETQAETGNIPETRALVLAIAREFAAVSELLRKRYPPST